MPLPPSFFYHVLRPGRYLGGEVDGYGEAPAADAKQVVWFYPERYDHAMTDPAWRRAFFQLRSLPGILPLRAVEYAADVWQRLEAKSLAPFTLDGHHDLRQAGTIVFWVPDVFCAAHIPAILKRIGVTNQTIGVVVDGWWAPLFLKDHVDWILPATSGWLPNSVKEILSSSGSPVTPDCYHKGVEWDGFWSGNAARQSLLIQSQSLTPNWIPRVEVDGAALDIELFEGGADGSLHPRPVASIVADAVACLRSTGAESMRFCDSGYSRAQAAASVLMEMSRLHNMKRVQVDLPPLTAVEFETYWKSYKPHLLKPNLRLRMTAGDTTDDLIAAGSRALNDGWHGLTAVLTFANFDEFSRLVQIALEAIRGWAKAAGTYTDKRPLRLQFDPAPVDCWGDPPSYPAEADFRRLASECRHFRDDISSVAAVGLFRIEDLIARNWLAATDIDLWVKLEALALADANDDAPPFDWSNWLRNQSGLTGPPQTGFSRRTPNLSIPSPAETSEGTGVVAAPLPSASGGDLFGRRRKKNGFSRRLSTPNRNRLRVQWGKSAEWRFYSHLDLVRVIERAIRKANLPATYSEGFHPRMKLSFGPPLAFGMTSKAEFFDLVMDRGVETADCEALEAAIPSGIEMVEAQGMPAQMPSLTETLNEAVYSAILPLDMQPAQDAIQFLMSQQHLSWSRPDRPDRRPFDPRVNLRSTSIESTDEGTRWELRVGLGTEGNLRPSDWASLIFGFDPEQIAALVMERSAMVIRLGDRVKSPFEFP